jgi:glycine cleavage system transcriptional repressor
MPNRYENIYVLSVLSDDHPGIVAAVGNAVARFEGNIDACSQTVLRGFFTLIMVVSLPQSVEPDDLAEEIRGQDARGSDLQVTVRPFTRTTSYRLQEPVERFVITAFGSDTPGVVLKFSRYLAGKDINIVDLFGQRSQGQFTLISQVEIPERLDIRMLQEELRQMGAESEFTVRLQHEDIFVATNQLRLRPQGDQPSRLPGTLHTPGSH